MLPCTLSEVKEHSAPPPVVRLVSDTLFKYSKSAVCSLDDESLALLNRGMKVKKSISKTLTLCASASLRETNSYFYSATPKVLCHFADSEETEEYN